MSTTTYWTCDRCGARSDGSMSSGPIRLSLQIGEGAQIHRLIGGRFMHFCRSCTDDITARFEEAAKAADRKPSAATGDHTPLRTLAR